jgi:hypothetical protein
MFLAQAMEVHLETEQRTNYTGVSGFGQWVSRVEDRGWSRKFLL